MGHHRAKQNKQPANTLAAQLFHYNNKLLDILACIYALVVIVVLPMYNKMSYARIGTEKRAFFTGFLDFFSKLVLPFLILQVILYLISVFKQHNRNLKDSMQSLCHSCNTLDLFVFCYMLSVLISYFASDYREVAVLGSPGWSMGTLVQLSMCETYFLISRFWEKRLWMVALLLPVSCIMFILGYFNRFGIWPIPMAANHNPQFISLAGNINWYCGYMVLVLLGSVYLMWAGAFSKVWQQRLLTGYLLVGFAALITNGSSSGILTLAAILYILLIMSISDLNKMLRFCKIVILLGISCTFTLCVRLLFPNAITYQETTNNLMTYSALPLLLLLFSTLVYVIFKYGFKRVSYPAQLFKTLLSILTCILLFVFLLFVIFIIVNTCTPGSIGPLSSLSVFTFSTEWGSRRGATWSAGAMAWWELSPFKKLVGVGPDCMQSYLYTDAGASLSSMLAAVWPSDKLANAHCEWLTVLVNLGVLGLISFAGMMISSILSFFKTGLTAQTTQTQTGQPQAGRIRAHHTQVKSIQADHHLVGACGLAILAYTIHNVVSFQQILNLPTMFILLAIGAAYRSR